MLRSILFNLYFYSINAALFIGGLPLLLLGTYGAKLGSYIWARAMVYGAKYIAGIDFEIKGELPQGTVIFASKHQSAWETAFFMLLPHQPVFVLKKELIYIPLLGLYLHFGGFIWVNRKRGGSALKKMLNDVQKSISSGHSVVIFPEGTRVKPGAESEIKPGIVALYNNVNAPVIPVSLNSGHFWPRNSFRKYPGKIIVEFGAPLKKELSREELTKELGSRINSGTRPE